MKVLVVILLLTVAVFQIRAQTNIEVPDIVLLTAELTNDPGIITYCGRVSCEIGLEFDTYKTFFKGIKIPVTVGPVSGYGQGFFVKGKHYLLTVTQHTSMPEGHLRNIVDSRTWYELQKAVKLD